MKRTQFEILDSKICRLEKRLRSLEIRFYAVAGGIALALQLFKVFRDSF